MCVKSLKSADHRPRNIHSPTMSFKGALGELRQLIRPYYVVNIRYITSSTTDFFFRLRASGTSAATNYNYQMLLADGTGASPTRSTSQTSFYGGGNTNGTFYSSTQLILFGPQLAEPTTIHGFNNQNAGSYTNTLERVFMGNHSTSTAYDGFELLIGTGTITGTYAVYGYRA